MSQTDVVTVLKIETGQSENTIKSIKKEISDLKKALESAEIGSEEFAKASRDLATAQANLKTIMADGKKAVDAADGSYNHLVATMAELKKQWRATADEAKRNEIGKQIDEINTKLKDMDATIGNHQRNVGNYTDSIVEAYQEIQGEVKKTNGVLAGSAKPIDTVTEATYDYGKAWSEVQKGTEQTRAKFESVQKMASGLASGFAAVQGAAALFGAENENLQKTLVKVQAAMAIAQGIGGLKDLIEGFSQAKTAFTGASMGLKAFQVDAVTTQTTMAGVATATNVATVATNKFKSALIKTGIGAILVGIGYAIGAIIDKLDKATEEQEAYNKAIEEQKQKEKERRDAVSSSVATVISSYNLLQAEWNELKTNQEKTDWIRDNADAFTDLGLAITDVASAQDVLINKADAVIKALTLQAEAAALQEIYQESYKEAYIRAKELESQMQDIKDNPIKAGYDTNDDFREKYNLGSNSFNKKTGYFQYTTRQEWSRLLGDYQTIYTYTDKLNQKGADYVQDQRIKAVQDQLDVVYDESNAILADVQAKEKEAADAQAEVSKYVVKTKRTATNTKSTAIDDTITKINTIQERVSQSLIDTREEELANLKKIYEEEKKLLEQNGKDTAALTEEYNLLVQEINEKYDKLEEENRQIARETLLQDLNERLAIINSAEQLAIRNLDREYQKRSIELDDTTTSILPSLKDDDNIAPIQLEIDKTLELQAIREQAFNEQMAQIQALLDAELQNDILTAEQEAELQTQYNDIQQQKIEATADANNQIAALNKQLVKQQQADNRQLAKNITTTFTSALNAASDILSAVQEGIDTTNKEGFEKNKKLQIANATIGMLVGITNAIAGLFTTKSGPWDIALAAIQAGAIATTGAIQIANIKKQTFDGSGGNTGNLNGSVGVSPNISMADMIPINYTKDVLTDTETAELNKGNKVYVLESDITETQNEVSVKESNSSF